MAWQMTFFLAGPRAKVRQGRGALAGAVRRKPLRAAPPGADEKREGGREGQEKHGGLEDSLGLAAINKRQGGGRKRDTPEKRKEG